MRHLAAALRQTVVGQFESPALAAPKKLDQVGPFAQTVGHGPLPAQSPSQRLTAKCL
jgi:hypothetical protein